MAEAHVNVVLAWILVAGTVVGLAIGQVLFKVGAMRLEADQPLGGMLSMINFPIIAALVVYLACTVLWVGALRTLPLRIAYPVSALGFVIVPILAHLCLHEPLTLSTLLGACLIISGVVLSASGS